jgi:hypothetical protein
METVITNKVFSIAQGHYDRGTDNMADKIFIWRLAQWFIGARRLSNFRFFSRTKVSPPKRIQKSFLRGGTRFCEDFEKVSWHNFLQGENIANFFVLAMKRSSIQSLSITPDVLGLGRDLCWT